MKKILYSMMAMAIAAFTFTACEDVPEPYNNPYANAKGEEVVEVDPVGSGTKDDPWNVTALANACEGLAEGAFLKDGAEVYVKGFVVETTEVSAQYGNATYYISDVAKNGKVRFYVFRGKLLDGASVTDANDLKVGDEVIVCGKVKNYKPASGDAVLEFDQGNYLVYLNGKTSGGDKPSTDAKKATVSEFLAAAESTSEWYQLTGTITHLEDGTYKNSTQYGNFDLVDETGSVYVYGVVAEKGGSKGQFAALMAEKGIKDGCKITIIGNRGAYNGNAQVTNAYFVSVESGSGTDVQTVGSKDAPKSISEALAAINAMEDNATSEEFWFVKGKVVKVTTNQTNFEKYGNLNYLISEDGTENNTITVYSGDGLNGDKFTGIDALEAGDEVIVYGQLQKYVKNGNMTPEIAKGNYLVALNKGGGNEDTNTVGSKDTPKSISEALTAINALEDNAVSQEFWFVKGKVVKVTTNQTNFEKYGNLNYLISEDGTENNTITVYSGDGLNGDKFTGIDALGAGDEVIVYGQLQKYVKNGNMTPEIAKGNYLVALNKGGDNGDQGGGSATTSTITMADFGLENQAELTTLTAGDGTKLTFSQEGGSNAPKYYTSGNAARMYALNSLTITANKAMTKVVLTCAMNGANPANGNDTMFGEAGGSKVTTNKDSDTQVTFSNFNNSTLKIVNDHTAASSGTQLRIVSIEITFAK